MNCWSNRRIGRKQNCWNNVKQKPIPDKKFKKCWRNSIPPEKRQEILKLRKYYKMEHYKISKLLNCVKVWDKKMDWSKWFIR